MIADDRRPTLTARRAPCVARLCATLMLLLPWLTFGAPAHADGSWRSSRPMETARSNSGSAVLDGEIYVAGGASVLGPRDVFEAFDPYSEIWRPLPAMPGGRERFGMAALNGRIYLTGGYGKESLAPRSDLWIYDANTGRWLSGPAMPDARAGHAMVAAAGRLYVLGGLGADGGSDAMAPVLTFDPRSGTWERTAWRLPAARGDLVAVSDGRNAIYAVGGRTQGGPVARVDQLDIASGSWTRLPDMPRARSGHTATWLGGRLHVTGGVAAEALKTLDAHDVYDPKRGRWIRAAPLPTPRHGLASATIGGRWFVIGGGAGAGFFTVFTEAGAVEIYEP